MTLGRAAVIAALVAAGCSWIGTASAQTARSFYRSPAEGPPGTLIAVSGKGCIDGVTPYESATVTMTRKGGQRPESSDVYPVQRDGTWGGELIVSYDAPLGAYTLSASCKNNVRTIQLGTAGFEVTAPPPDVAPTPSSTSKPHSTGSPSASASPPPVAQLTGYPSPSSNGTADIAAEPGPTARRDRSTSIALIGGGVAIGLVGALIALLRRIR